jgi:glucokinase
MYYLGIEIGGTKIQVGVGADDGRLAALWRGPVDVAAGPDGIRRQIAAAVPEVLSRAGLERSQVRGVGVGFGGPVDDATRRVIKSHQIEGWDDFPLADWVGEVVGLPAALGNDADVAGLAEALHGAGKGLSPIFYITIGSGIGGGFIIDGEIYRGVGRGAAEIGHLWTMAPADESDEDGTFGPLESVASGWAIDTRAKWVLLRHPNEDSLLRRLAGGEPVTARHIAQAIEQDDPVARSIMDWPIHLLAQAICQAIALLCPRRIVIGGGVSLMGERGLFAPLRRKVAEMTFRPFSGLTDIAPAALGEEVVVHGAIALARKRLGENA